MERSMLRAEPVRFAQDRKAQSGVEFIIFISIMLFVFSISYLTFFYEDMSIFEEKSDSMTIRAADKISFEINTALSIGDGYSKQFELPETIMGREYSISVESGLVFVESGKSSAVTHILTDNITGQVMPGTNYMKNTDGEIFVNV